MTHLDLIITSDTSIAHLAVHLDAQHGYRWPRSLTGAGYYIAKIRLGTRRCDCFASSMQATGTSVWTCGSASLVAARS